MYKKKSKAPMIATVAVLVVVFMLLIGVNVMRNRANNVEPQTEPETETPVHNLVLYKSSDASMEFDEGWLKSDGDEEAILEIAEDAFVTIRVTPKEGKDLDKVDIMDYELKKLEYYVLDGENREKRVNFVMPKKDMVVNMTFVSEDKDADKDKDGDVDESETSGMPYNLTLHGLTTDIIMSYNGQFDDHDFLQQFGDSLHIDSARSEYSDVTDITFSTRPYEGEQDSDKVYHYIYLNGNVNRELLATFYSKEGKYVFTKAEDMEEVSDQPETEAAPVQTSGNGSNTGNNNGNGTSTQTTGGSTPGTSYTEEGTSVSFDILKVSQNLCDFCGGKDKFYDEAWEYVLSKKLTGEIVGTMSDHKIDGEAGKAEFDIKLNIGKTIHGTYVKETKKFIFSGL